METLIMETLNPNWKTVELSLLENEGSLLDGQFFHDCLRYSNIPVGLVRIMLEKGADVNYCAMVS